MVKDASPHPRDPAGSGGTGSVPLPSVLTGLAGEPREEPMSEQATAARTPGAKRAGPGEYLFDLARVNHIKGGPDYSSVEGGVVEGDRMIVALMRMPAGTGAVA